MVATPFTGFPLWMMTDTRVRPSTTAKNLNEEEALSLGLTELDTKNPVAIFFTPSRTVVDGRTRVSVIIQSGKPVKGVADSPLKVSFHLFIAGCRSAFFSRRIRKAYVSSFFKPRRIESS